MEYILILIALYFIPWMIASVRGHNNSAAIFLLNLFLGWTFLGWIIALVWSATNDTRRALARNREPPYAATRTSSNEVAGPHTGAEINAPDRNAYYPAMTGFRKSPVREYFDARFTPGTLVGVFLLIVVLLVVLKVGKP